MSWLHKEWNTLRGAMYAMDWYFVAIIALYGTLTVCFWHELPHNFLLLLENVSFLAFMIIVIRFGGSPHSGVLHTVRRFYVIPFVYPMYLQTFQIVPYLRTARYDATLAAIDRWIFGIDPTSWMYRYAHPLLTEYLQWCYVSFFFVPCIHAIVLYRDKRFDEFEQLSRLMVFSFFISYVAYFAFPAIGPRFSIHDFFSLNADLPGLWFAEVLREQVNTGGGIPLGTTNPAAFVHTDCMPSGHTMMTVVNVMLAWKFSSRGKWLYTIIGCSLIIATVYLRYHYVIDVVAGIGCALLMFPLEERCNELVKRHLS